MKPILAILIGIFLFTSCGYLKEEEPQPAYIQIDSFTIGDSNLVGSKTEKITDAWVTYNGIRIGTFELPAFIPVIPSDSANNLFIQAGIQVNGLVEARTAYPFYSAFSQEMELTPGKVLTLNPEITYRPEEQLTVIADYDFEGTNINMTTVAGNSEVKRTNRYTAEGTGAIHIELDSNENNELVIVTPDPTFTFPPVSASPAVMIEMDYMCDHNFSVGVLFDDGIESARWIVTLTPTEGVWKKVYVNLTGTMNQLSGVAHKATIGAVLDDEKAEANIFIDNFKIISTK